MLYRLATTAMKWHLQQGSIRRSEVVARCEEVRLPTRSARLTGLSLFVKIFVFLGEGQG